MKFLSDGLPAFTAEVQYIPNSFITPEIGPSHVPLFGGLLLPLIAHGSPLSPDAQGVPSIHPPIRRHMRLAISSWS